MSAGSGLRVIDPATLMFRNLRLLWELGPKAETVFDGICHPITTDVKRLLPDSFVPVALMDSLVLGYLSACNDAWCDFKGLTGDKNRQRMLVGVLCHLYGFDELEALPIAKGAQQANRSSWESGQAIAKQRAAHFFKHGRSDDDFVEMMNGEGLIKRLIRANDWNVKEE